MRERVSITIQPTTTYVQQGKVAKVPLNAYETKANRKKLTGAYCDKSQLKAALAIVEDIQVAVYSTDGRCLIFSTAQLAPKTTRNTQGVSVLTLKKKAELSHAVPVEKSDIVNQSRYRTRTLPAAGALLKPEDVGEEQIQLEV